MSEQIEQLTEAQRLWLTRYKSRGPGILRIIDAQAAALAARDQRVAELERDGKETQRWADIYRERALKAEAETEMLAGSVKDAESEVALLREVLAAAKRRRVQALQLCDERESALKAAEARVQELEATGSAHERHGACAEREVSEALRQLAAANALLREVYECGHPFVREILGKIARHLSAQPAAPEKCEAWQDIDGIVGRCVRCWCDECQCQPTPPTDPDRAVLDACAALTVSHVMGPPTVHKDGLDAVIAAELARREAKRCR